MTTAIAWDFAEYVQSRAGHLLRTARLLIGDQHRAEALVQVVLAANRTRWGRLPDHDEYLIRTLYARYLRRWDPRWRPRGPTAGPMTRLSRAQRAVVVCMYANDRSTSETARLLDWSYKRTCKVARSAERMMRPPGSIELALLDLIDGHTDSAPSYRLWQIGQRRRRAGRIWVGALVAFLTMMITLSFVPTGGGGEPPLPPSSPSAVAAVPLGQDGCPGALPAAVPVDAPGPLAPKGAVAIMRCVLPQPACDQRCRADYIGPPLLLTTHVSDVVDELNKADVVSANASCQDTGLPGQLSLVLRYPDAAPLVIWIYPGCAIFSDSHLRRPNGARPAEVFAQWYRSQSAVRAVPPPVCPPTFPAGHFERRTEQDGPRDGIGLLREAGEPFIPAAMSAFNACRYLITPKGARLVAEWRLRDGDDGLISVRIALNEDIQPPHLDITNGELTGLTECGQPGQSSPAEVVDVIQIVDSLGATSEVWVLRAPCIAVVQRGKPPIAATSALISLLDDGFSERS
jgi:hypothetical protein